MKMTAYMKSGLLAAMLAMPARAAMPEDWVVKDAPIRFVLDLTTDPSHASAGHFVTIPDGGILPGPAPDPQVFDEAGAPLASGVLWHCPDTGCGLVFQAPKAGRSVVIYVGATPKAKVWTPQSGLTPSAILCETRGNAGQKEALQLAQLGLVGPVVRYVNQGWTTAKWQNEKVPLSLWNWRPAGVAMYLLAYVDVTDPGPTWVAPLGRAGLMDVAVDGQMIAMARKSDKRGGVGAVVPLTSGLHKVELYAYSPEGGATGPLMLTWRPPKTTTAELGGVRSPDVKYPGTPMFESRMVKDSEVVKSGECRVREIQTRDGGPVASFTMSAENVFAFEGEDALVHCLFKAWTRNNPAGARYSWRFDGVPGASPAGAELNWLFKSGVDGWVTLTVEADGKRSTARSLFSPFSGVRSSIERPATREAFRTACLAMLQSYPDKTDPVAKWDTNVWNNLFRVLELKTDDTLVEYVVTNRWDFFRKKLDADRKAILEDSFLISMAVRNPQEAMRWAQEFAKDAPSHPRSVMLQLKRAEILMYYSGDLDGARKIITPLLSDNSEGGEWARIRMGDLEILARNLNEATQRYGDVQNRSKANTGEPTTGPTRLKETPTGPMNAADFAKLKAPKKGGGKKAVEEVEPPPNVAYWKLAAIRDVAASENVGNLIDQGFHREALVALRSWERSFPLTKITGDYILREAKLYMALKDYKRARVILRAYCDQVDTSNFLPEALQLIRKCMIFMNEPEAEMAKYEKEILKRTQFGGKE
jgi:hypothetical protein